MVEARSERRQTPAGGPAGAQLALRGTQKTRGPHWLARDFLTNRAASAGSAPSRLLSNATV